MPDVHLFQTDDGGDVEVGQAEIVLSDGLETSAYLSLFGGNADDGGLTATEAVQWWGNRIESDPARRLRSRTQYLLNRLPLTPANLKRFEDAANEDLAWMLESLASEVSVTVIIPARNTVRFVIAIVIRDERFKFVFDKQKPE